MRRTTDPHKVLRDIKVYAVEVAVTIAFLFWLGKVLWHELGL
jgi:hypothetical protein